MHRTINVTENVVATNLAGVLIKANAILVVIAGMNTDVQTATKETMGRLSVRKGKKKKEKNQS